MNYTEYNNQLKLPDDLYKKTLAGVKSEISKQNQIQRKKESCFFIICCLFYDTCNLNINS